MEIITLTATPEDKGRRLDQFLADCLEELTRSAAQRLAEEGQVRGTPDRSKLFAVQTPQVFERMAIEAAIVQAMEQGIPLTDDCSAAEAAGITVVLTEGSDENIKITTPVDLHFGEAILQRRDEL